MADEASEPSFTSEVPPFLPYAAAAARRPVTASERDLLLKQGRPLRGAEGELVARKQHVRVPASVLSRSERLSALLDATPSGEPLTLTVHAEAISVEACARVLEWQASPPVEQRECLEHHCSWQHLSALMHAAAWLGYDGMVRACEAKLCTQLRLENAVQLARAADRVSARQLLARCFFLLKAFFCSSYEEARPTRVDGRREPVPRMIVTEDPSCGATGSTAMRYSNTIVPQALWQPTVHEWGRINREACVAQPRYTLCTMYRERSPDGPSLFRLVSEHDNRVLLVARQRWPGEGDFLIFAPPDDDDYASVPATSPAGPGSASDEPTDVEPTATDVDGGIAVAEARCESAAPDANAAESEAVSTRGEASSTRGVDATHEDAGGNHPSVGADSAIRAAAGEEEAESAAMHGAGSQGGAAAGEMEAMPTADGGDAPGDVGDRPQQSQRARRSLDVDAFIQSIREAEAETLPEHCAAYRGCVSPSWLGLQFSVYDGGLRPEHAKSFPFPQREELAVVTYASNLLKSRPHSLSIVVQDGSMSDEERRERSGGSLLDAQKSGQREGVYVLQNTQPEWDESIEAYTLPFYQRVVLPSKKNVHIVQPHAPDDIVLLFGKRAKSSDRRVTTYSLDFCRPISCLAAFGVALTAFAGSA